MFGPDTSLPPHTTDGAAAVTTLHTPVAPGLQESEQIINSNQDEVTLLSERTS